MKKTYLITTSTCPKCDDVKEWIKKNNIDVEIVEADTDKHGRHMGYKLGIEKIPVFVVVEKHTIDEFKNLK